MSDQRSVRLDDAQAVLWSAEILGKSEFEVFETAYQVWYREAADTNRLERIFADYMFDEVVPFWVRQFIRETLDSHDGWQRNDELTVHEYLGICLGAASATILSTTRLALSLFAPYVVFPRNDTYFDAFPA